MNEKNLKPFKKGEISSEVAKERGRNGALKTAQIKREKKTLAQIFQIWAENQTSEKNQRTLQSIGVDDTTNKASLILPILNGIGKGDKRYIDMALELLQEDRKKEKEIERLQKEIERIELEKQKLEKELNGEFVGEQIVILNDVPNKEK